MLQGHFLSADFHSIALVAAVAAQRFSCYENEKNNYDFPFQTAYSQNSVTRAAHTVRRNGPVPLIFNELMP